MIKEIWKVENAAQTEELYILRRQTGGDYKFETGSDQEIYRIKQRDYGFEIETPNKVSRYKIKRNDGKLSLRNASETTVLYTNDPLPAIALVPFGLDELPLAQQIGLTYALYAPGQSYSMQESRGQAFLAACAELSCPGLIAMCRLIQYRKEGCIAPLFPVLNQPAQESRAGS